MDDFNTDTDAAFPPAVPVSAWEEAINVTTTLSAPDGSVLQAPRRQSLSAPNNMGHMWQRVQYALPLVLHVTEPTRNRRPVLPAQGAKSHKGRAREQDQGPASTA